MPAVPICADDDVAVAVEHQAGQPVGLAVHQPVERRVVQPLAQRERDLQAVHDQRLARRMRGIATEDARADQRVRIDVGVAEELVAIADDAAQRAGLRSCVSGVRAVSTSLLNTQRCPAAAGGLRRA